MKRIELICTENFSRDEFCEATKNCLNFVFQEICFASIEFTSWLMHPMGFNAFFKKVPKERSQFKWKNSQF